MERDAHVRETHAVDSPRTEGKRVLTDSDDYQGEEAGQNREVGDDHSRDSQLEEEADEIVNNATYLASQMKVARVRIISLRHLRMFSVC